MSFRPADEQDEEFFLHWRLRAENHGREGGWWDGEPVTPQAHHEWFIRRLRQATMLVWYYDKRPAGAVRIDSNGEVAFDAHPWLTAKMLEELKPYAAEYGGRLKVTVDRADAETSKKLRAADYREYPVRFHAYRP